MNKRGFELAISTIILIILGLMVLIALLLAFTSTFEKLIAAIRGYSGSDIDNLSKMCQAQCNLENKYSFCCEEKQLRKEQITCLDERVNFKCDSINCEEVKC